MRGSRRTGAALIDVLVAVVLLSLAGTACVALLGQTAWSMRRTRDAERAIVAASQELARVAVMDAAQLASMRGKSIQHGWMVTVEAESSTVFTVAIATVAGVPMLRTTLYKPDSTHGAP